MKNILTILNLSKNFTILAILVILSSILSFSDLFYPHIYGVFFNVLSAKGDFLIYIWIILAYFSFFFVFNITFSRLSTIYFFKVVKDIKTKMVHSFFNLNEDYIKKKGTGHFVPLMSYGVFNIVAILQKEYVSSFLNIIKIPVIIVILYFSHYSLGLIVSIWAIAYVMTHKLQEKTYTNLYNKMMDSFEFIASRLVERMNSRELVRIHRKTQDHFESEIGEALDNEKTSSIKSNNYISINYAVVGHHLEPFFRISFIAVMAFLFYNNEIDLGAFVANMAYFFLIKTDISQSLNFIEAYNNSKESACRVEKYLQKKDSRFEKKIEKPYDFFLKMKNFSYSYNKMTKKLVPQNLTFPIDQCYALKGENGLGKSTLVKIILGINQIPYEGKLFFVQDELDIHYSLENMAYISQNLLIISDYSFEENIHLKDDNLDKNYLKKIISELDIDYLRNKDPSNISGGEKRKIILARFIYHLRHKDFYILDEVFVSLDANYIDFVLPIIKTYIHSKTGIVISHNHKVIDHLCNNFSLNKIFEKI